MRIIANSFIEASSSILDIKCPLLLDSEGLELTINEYCLANNKAVEESNGRFILPIALSDLTNDFDNWKLWLRNNELVGGGNDFTQIGDEFFWILSYDEKNEFKQVNPNWNIVSESL